MANALTIKLSQGSLKSVEGAVKKIGKFPDLISQSMNQWGQILAKDMQVSAAQNTEAWRGTLASDKGIQWRQKPKGRLGRLFMYKYGVQLDSMRTHWVSLKRGRTITMWAEDKLKGNLPKAIEVHKHPFIRKGYDRARPKLRAMINQSMRRNKT